MREQLDLLKKESAHHALEKQQMQHEVEVLTMLKQDSDARVADAETALNRIVDETCAAAGVTSDKEHFENVSLHDLRAFEKCHSTLQTESFGVCTQVQATPNAFAALADCIMQVARRDVSQFEDIVYDSGLRGGRTKGTASAIGKEWLVHDLLREVMRPLCLLCPTMTQYRNNRFVPANFKSFLRCEPMPPPTR